MDNELLLIDRLGVIRDTINSYGEENFYLSFSGGKDSTVLHHLLDMALPGNKIPRVFINTGIEYLAIVNHVKRLAENDSRVKIIQPTKNIKQVLDTYGYPFKSKDHAKKVWYYQQHGIIPDYYISHTTKTTKFHCPDILQYQFTNQCSLKISHLCCQELKKKPVKNWQKKHNIKTAITGLRATEGGNRVNSHCILSDKKGGIRQFNPLIKVNEQWVNWFVDQYKIELCALYYEPYNFERTGCKGCPFALGLQEQLETMEKYLPAERKQCEYIWKPVYAEYRRLGYRLKKDEQLKLF